MQPAKKNSTSSYLFSQSGQILIVVVVVLVLAIIGGLVALRAYKTTKNAPTLSPKSGTQSASPSAK